MRCLLLQPCRGAGRQPRHRHVARSLVTPLADARPPVALLLPLHQQQQWRTSFRKDMNRAEAQANNRAVDSLINYETVKYCGNEEHEVARYDECMAKYQARCNCYVTVM